MTTYRCKALNCRVNTLVLGQLARQLEPSDADTTSNYPVLTIHLLVILAARHQTLVKDARLGRVDDLQCGRDRRHHRHDLNRCRSMASEHIGINIPKIRNQAYRS